MTTTAIFTITIIILIVLTTATSASAGGPRLDWPEDSSDEGKDCWVEGYDSGFAQKYDKERADQCAQENDEYNRSWGYACIDSGITKIDCDNIKDNPVDTVNPNSLEEENRRTCYDDGYEDGKNNAYDDERRYRCSEFGDPYRDGFMAACQFGNTYDVCNSFTEITQIEEQTNMTAEVSVTDEQDNNYYAGFDWLGVCNNPLVRNYITQQCDVLVTSDGNALTSEGKAAMEAVLCPQGRGIIGIIEFAYKPIPSSLEEELASACGWS
jgi:hypothetical protein